MTAEADEYRALVMAEIGHHLQVHGAKNWEELRAKHPTVGERTFFRWVKAVREKGASPEATKLAVKRARVEAMKDVPAAPPPSTFAREGAVAVRKLDFLVALGRLYEEAEQLAEYATLPPKEGETRRAIKNPILFDSSIKRRMDVIKSYVSVFQEIYDLERMREFYDLIIEEIGLAAPDVQRAIMGRLVDLNAKHGMTIHART